MMKNLAATLIVFSSFYLHGCATPLIKYKIIQHPQDAAAMSVTYKLRKSIIQITNNDIAAGEDEKGQKLIKPIDFTVEGIPAESKDIEIGIKPADSSKGHTVLTFNKFKDTNLIAKIKSDTQSVAPELVIVSINNIKEAAKYFVGNLVDSVTAQPLSINDMNTAQEELIPLDEAKQCIPVGQSIQFSPNFSRSVEQVKGANGENCITVQYEDLAINAKPIKDINWNTETSNFYFSACRNALVTINQADNRPPKTYHLKIADPRYIQQILIPYKGELFAESGCGFYSVVENSGANLNIRPQ